MNISKYFNSEGLGTHNVLRFTLVFENGPTPWMQRVQNIAEISGLLRIPGAEIHYIKGTLNAFGTGTGNVWVTVPKSDTLWMVWGQNIVHFSNLLGQHGFMAAFGEYNIEFLASKTELAQ